MTSMLWKQLFPEFEESTPEEKLWAAVFVEAMKCALGKNITQAVLARQFFFGNGENRWMFDWISDVLDRDASHLRGVMRQLIERRREDGRRTYQHSASWLYEQAGMGGAR